MRRTLDQACNFKIQGVGAYLPPMRVSSNELMREIRSEDAGIPESFLERATGIIERRICTDPDTLTSMATNASLGAMSDAGLSASDIDCVIYCGIESEDAEPSTAHHVQRAIGAQNAVCFDVSNACLGLLNGLSIANAYLSSSNAEHILICTGEKPSDVTFACMQQFSEDRSRENFRRLMGAFTVGDAGGAFVLGRPDSEQGGRVMKFATFSEHSTLCYYKRHQDKIEFAMEMETISNAMVSAHEAMIGETYEALGWSGKDVDALYCHQVGAKPHRKMAAISSLSHNKAPKTYDRYGNLTSATFAVNMSLNKPAQGSKVLFLGAGSGLSICQIGLQF